MPVARDLIRYATLAANGHNTQAWQFRETSTAIDILPDLSRRTPAVDPDDHHLFANPGCATENLSLAMAAQGKGGGISIDPEGTVRVAYGTRRSAETALFDAIPLRQSTRSDYDCSVVRPDILMRFGRAVAMPWLVRRPVEAVLA
jgi:hypothetical protein